MSFSTQNIGDVWVVTLKGEVWGGLDYVELENSLAAIADRGGRKFLIDLGRTQYVNSNGIGILVALHSLLQSRDAQLKLCSVSSRSKRALEVTGVWQLFEVHEDRAVALGSFAQVPARVA